MANYSFGLLLVLLARVSSFQFRGTNPEGSAPPSVTAPVEGNKNRGFDARDAFDILPKRSKDPPTSVVSDDESCAVDLDKARDAASHYGKYSYKEVEHMRNDLHADRVKNASPNDVLFLERYLEDELTSQLRSLKEDAPDPYLFPNPDGTVPTGLFGSETIAAKETETGTAGIKTATATENPDTTGTTNAVNFEAPALLLEDGVLENIVVFIVAGILTMMPQ